MVFIEIDDGIMSDCIKLLNNVEKVIILGKKNVYCIINNKIGKVEGDYIMLEGENFNDEFLLKMFYFVYIYKMKFIKLFKVVNLY